MSIKSDKAAVRADNRKSSEDVKANKTRHKDSHSEGSKKSSDSWTCFNCGVTSPGHPKGKCTQTMEVCSICGKNRHRTSFHDQCVKTHGLPNAITSR